MPRLCFAILCAVPFLDIALALRPLRISGLYQPLGAAVFLVIAAAIAIIGAPAWRDPNKRPMAVGATLLLVPFTLVALLWVGLGPPWEATPVENRMRYVVLLAAASAVTGGLVMLKEGLAGERLYSTIGLSAGLLAGAAYLVWASFAIAIYILAVRAGKIDAVPAPLAEGLGILLFFACVLTYLATAAFAAALRVAGWLGRGASTAYISLALIALVLIMVRGLSFPDPNAAPWYTSPGFIVGIPAVPWIMPHLLGVVVLRRAGR